MKSNKSKSDLFRGFLGGMFLRQEFTFDSLYSKRTAKKIVDDSDKAGKNNNPALEQEIFVTMQEGASIIKSLGNNLFENVGDCDEKPVWK